MFTVQHHSYCGMSGLRHEFDDSADARQAAAKRLRAYRRRYRVTTLERGRLWEVLEPENCALVPDACGTLTLSRRVFECRECGYGHDTRDAAAQCCVETEEE